MDGVWYKRCPWCGNYMKNQTPQEAFACCACGWEEERSCYFCTYANRYCSLMPVIAEQ